MDIKKDTKKDAIKDTKAKVSEKPKKRKVEIVMVGNVWLGAHLYGRGKRYEVTQEIYERLKPNAKIVQHRKEAG